MRRTYKFRIYANKATIGQAERTIEACRLVYNDAIAHRREYYEQVKLMESGRMMHQPILFYKKDGNYKRSVSYFDQCFMITHKGHEHLKDFDSGCLCSALQQLDAGYKSYFDLIKKYKKGLNIKYNKYGNPCPPLAPHFRKKGEFNRFTYKSSGWKLEDDRLILSKIGAFKVKLHREMKGDIKTVTIKAELGGKWYACFSCDNVPKNILPKTGGVVGLDMGLTRFVTDSNGGYIRPPKFFEQSARQMRRLQRSMSRCVKGSNRWRKAKDNVAKLYQKIQRRREYFIKCVAKPYIDANDVVVIENLNVSGMVRGKNLGKKINDAAWASFFKWLDVKADETGRTIIKINPAYTSQMCSRCGYVSRENRETQSKFECKKCGHSENADVNAAKNIAAHAGPSGANSLGCQELSENYTDNRCDTPAIAM